MGYLLRQMTERDIGQIAEIEREAFTLPWSAEALLGELKKKNLSVFLVLINSEDPDEILGYCGYWKIMNEAHIMNIAVRKDYRGKGFGRFILKEIIKSALSFNLKQITLEVRVSNYVALNLYESLGFKNIGVRRNYYSDTGEDALIMWLYIDEGGEKNEVPK